MNDKKNLSILGYNEGFISIDKFHKIIQLKLKKIVQNKISNKENKNDLDYINNKYKN